MDLVHLAVAVVALLLGIWLMNDPEIIHQVWLTTDSLNNKQGADELERANWARSLDGSVHRFLGFFVFAYGLVVFFATIF
jgi:hypothetical protein